MEVRPLPDKQGVGFCAMKPLDIKGYRYEQVGMHHNYHFTQDNWSWPEKIELEESFNIDAFAPNLNKQLHVGHLRQLSLAVAFKRLFPHARFVALLGKSIGYTDGAFEALQNWFDFTDYHPDITMDEMMAFVDEQENLIPKENGTGEYEGCKIWNGPKGPIVVRRSNGSATYALHDLVFANKVGPKYYITGEEQKEHFASLNLADKHLAMGLVLDANTKKKMKSRDGTAISATEVFSMVMDKLKETPCPKELAWNVLTWNFLHVSRSQNVIFDPDKWTLPDSPGMYISYTYARIYSALSKTTIAVDSVDEDFTENDIALLGTTSYLTHWLIRSRKTMDFAILANYAHHLARKLGNAYHSESIKDGRTAFKIAVSSALVCLKNTMNYLGMFPLNQI